MSFSKYEAFNRMIDENAMVRKMEEEAQSISSDHRPRGTYGLRGPSDPNPKPANAFEEVLNLLAKVQAQNDVLRREVFELVEALSGTSRPGLAEDQHTAAAEPIGFIPSAICMLHKTSQTVEETRQAIAYLSGRP